MRKFLSILMLACLLCGLALPAAAEGEQLYARVGEDTEFQTSLTFEKGKTLIAQFYTEQAEEGLITDTTVSSDKNGLSIEGPGKDGKCTLSATAADTYTISFEREGTTYQIGVEVKEPEAPSTTNTIPVPNAAKLSEILSSQENFDAFINGGNPDGLTYSGSGDLILLLPTGDMGSVTCSVKLDNGNSLVLKGASNKGTRITSIVINSGDIVLVGIEFSTAPSTTVAASSAISVQSSPSTICRVVDCTFSLSSTSNENVTYAFHLAQNSGSAPMLSLDNNTFNYGCNISISGGGVWRAIKSTKLQFGAVDFGVALTKTDSYIKAVFSDSISKLTDSSQIFKWTYPVGAGFKDCFVTYDRKIVDGSSIDKNNMLTFEVERSGEYTIVAGKYPVLEKKNGYYQLKVEEFHLNYLDEVTVESPYAAVNVTLSTKAVDSTVDTINGTRYLTIPNLKAGTYVIKEATKTVTKTVTKTTTTSRKYSTTYQDYFLVTPKGFSNAMRYVKDNLVTLNCTEAGRRPVSLPVASMREAAEKGYSVLVKTKNAELTMDPAALKSMAQQAKGTTVLLHYKSLNHKTMSGVGQSSVESHVARNPSHVADLAFLVTATSDNETIEDLQQGSVQLKIPFIVLPGTEDKGNTVYALQSETVTEARETVVADGCLTTKLLDLTEHMVFQIGEPMETTVETTEETTEETTVETTEETTEPETEPTEPEVPEEEGGGLLGVVLAVLGVMLAVVCGVLGFVFIRRRKK